jgi:hypothetical protein
LGRGVFTKRTSSNTSFAKIGSVTVIQGGYKLSEYFAKPCFTDTEQKYMMLLPFERGMFAV